RKEERRGIDDSPRRRQLHREGKEQQPRVRDDPLVPRQTVERRQIHVPREEAVGVARVPREEPLQIFGCEIARVILDEAGETIVARHAGQTIQSSRPTFPNTSTAYCSSSRVCVAVPMVRTRALSRATVGNAMPWANTPSWKSRSDSCIASAPSPAMTGVMGLSLRPVLNPSAFRPALKNFVFSHSRSMISGSSISTSIAAMHAAATAGGCDVENRNG